jgi:hypothetical protein
MYFDYFLMVHSFAILDRFGPDDLIIVQFDLVVGPSIFRIWPYIFNRRTIQVVFSFLILHQDVFHLCPYVDSVII